MFHEYEKWSALFQLNVIWSALVNHGVCTIPTSTILVCSITTYKIVTGLPYSNIKSMGLPNYNMTKRSLYYSNLVVCFIPTQKRLPSYNIRLDLITVTPMGKSHLSDTYCINCPTPTPVSHVRHFLYHLLDKIPDCITCPTP